jgi:hypothetical protein
VEELEDSIFNSIYKIAGIKINLNQDQSELPAKICLNCLEQLGTACKFRKHIIESDITLKKLFPEDVSIKLEPSDLMNNNSDNEDLAMKFEVSGDDYEPERETEFVSYEPKEKKKKKCGRKSKIIEDKDKKPENFQCATCGKILLSGGALASHERSHVRSKKPKQIVSFILILYYYNF